MARRVRTGDFVIVISGKCKNNKGKVISVDSDRVVIDGVNKKMRHIKKTQDSPGRVDSFFAPVHISNVMHCVNDQPVKVGFTMIDGKKYLINKKTSERIRSVW